MSAPADKDEATQAVGGEDEVVEEDVGYYNPRPVDPILPVRIVVDSCGGGDGGGDVDGDGALAVASADDDAANANAAAAGPSRASVMTPPPPMLPTPSPAASTIAALADLGAPSSPQARLRADPAAAAAAAMAAADGGASAGASVALLCNSAVGAGVLALPYALARAGMAGGLLLCAGFCAVEAFTLYVLAKFAERYSARSYGQLVRRALGRRSSALLSASMFVLQWGACVAYLVIVGDVFSGVLGALLGPGRGGKGGEGGSSGGGGLADDDARLFATGVGGIDGSESGGGGGATGAGGPLYRTQTLVAVALGVVFPLCLPADLAALEAVSAAAVVGFGFTAFTVVVRGWQLALSRPAGERFARVRLWPADGGLGLLDAIPLVVFGFNSHANVVAIFHELEPFPSAPVGARTVARRAAAAVGVGLGSRVGSYARSLAAAAAAGGGGNNLPTSMDAPSFAQHLHAPLLQLQPPTPPTATSLAAAAAVAAAGSVVAASVAPTAGGGAQPLLLRGVRTHKLFGMVGVIAAAMVLIACGYVLVAIAGFVAFAPTPPSNILNAFAPSGDGLITAARLVIGLVVVAHYPLACHPAREALRDLSDALFRDGGEPPAAAAAAGGRDDGRDDDGAACKKDGGRGGGGERDVGGAAGRFLYTAVFVLSTLATAVAAGDLGGVLHLLGGTVASAMIFGLPGLLLINASIIKLSYGGDWGEGGGGGEEDFLAEEEEGEGGGGDEGGPSGDGEGGGGGGGGGVPATEDGTARRPLLLAVRKKAGLREKGLIYSPGASWAAGVALCGVCLAVMGLTIASAFVGKPDDPGRRRL